MTDDLKARLRWFDPHTHELEVVDEAADRIEALELALTQSQDIIDRWINTSSEQYQTIVETQEALTQSRAETAAAVAEAHACGEERAAWKEKAEWAQEQLAVWSSRAIALRASSLATPDQTAALDAVRAEVLDAASAYMDQQYGNRALSNPIDRKRIFAAIKGAKA